jgi:hypothetical protein
MTSTPKRYIEDQVFISTDTPPLRLQFDPALRYVGNVEFDLKGIAHVDRQVWVEAGADSLIQRMLILQFEGFLDNNSRTYSYRPINLIRLGNELYGHNNYVFSVAAEIAEAPEAETAHTLQLLTAKGFQLSDEQMTSRFARIIDPERRNELIIFYHENIREAGLILAEISDDGEIAEQYADLKSALTRRSLESFKIL